MTRVRVVRLNYDRLLAVHRNSAVGLPCVYCWEPMLDPTWDHVIPRSRGGTNARANLVVCCTRCNHLKADRTLPEYAGHLYATGSPCATRVNRLISWLTREWSQAERREMARLMAAGWVVSKRFQRTRRRVVVSIRAEEIPAGITATMRRMIETWRAVP